jgi:hypothetical protein
MRLPLGGIERNGRLRCADAARTARRRDHPSGGGSLLQTGLRFVREDPLSFGMTAAPESMTGLASRGWAATPFASAFAHAIRRWERTLATLGVLLPIPLFAATGLSIPLPATVERLAAALVPWADDVALLEGQAFSLGENGSIVLAPGERPASASADPRASSSADDQLRRQQAGERTEGDGSRSHGSETGTAGGGGGAQDGSGATSTTQGGGGQSDDPGSSSSGGTGPVQDTVDDVGGATEPVVGALEGAVEDIPGTGGTGGIVDGVGETAGDTAAEVDGVLAGLGD